jgi:CRP/FNR family transcriptional activator FtrB
VQSVDIDQIRTLPLFATMAPDNFDSLMKVAYLQRFPAQIELINEGDFADFLYVVLEGRVELYSTGNDRETTMAMITPVSTFLLAATIKSASYLMSGRTIKASRVLLIPSEDVRRILDIDPGFSRAIVDELATCYRSVVKATKNLKLRTAVERVGNYIIRLQDKSEGADMVELPVGKRVLASMLGMTPENLSRAFSALQSYGILVSGPRIEITDRDALVTYCKPNPLIDDMTT